MRGLSWILGLIPATLLSPLAFAASPVELAFARYEVHYGKQPGQNFTGLIRVAQTVAPDNVVVHYTRNDRDWQDVKARYQGLEGEYQLWNFAIPSDLDGSRSYRLAVHADTGSESIWDNNNWQDFRIDGGKFSVPSNTVVLLKNKPVALQGAFAYASQGWITGTIDIENPGDDKAVRVVYRVNGGEPQVASAGYSSTHADSKYETWRFDLRVPKTAEVSFAVELEHEGRIYTDDNFGRSYQAFSGWVKTLY